MKTPNIIVSYTNQSVYRIISVSILAQAFGLKTTEEESKNAAKARRRGCARPRRVKERGNQNAVVAVPLRD